MRFQSFFLPVLASAFAVRPVAALVTYNPATEYPKLLKMCKDGGDSVYVGVRYDGGNYRTFAYNECYPYEIEGNLAQMAVFCKSTTCYSNPNPDCSGGVVPPVPVPIVAGLTLINAGNWVQLLGQGATCQNNNLGNPNL